MRTFSDSEYSDEMQNYEAFYQMFTLTDLRRKKYIMEIITCYPSIHTLKLPKFIVHIKPKEKNTKG